MTTAETIKDLLTRTEALRRYLNIDSLVSQISEEEKQTEAPSSSTAAMPPKRKFSNR